MPRKIVSSPLQVFFEVMIYHRSYTHNLSSCEIKAWKWRDFFSGFNFTIDEKIQDWIFLRLQFHKRLSCVYSYNDKSCLHIFLRSSNNYMIFHIFVCILHLLRVIAQSTEPVSQMSWVRIPFRPGFFQCITAMINHVFFRSYFLSAHELNASLEELVKHNVSNTFVFLGKYGQSEGPKSRSWGFLYFTQRRTSSY